VAAMTMGETSSASLTKPLALGPSGVAACTGEEEGCGRMVISTCWSGSRGDAAVVSGKSSLVSWESARRLLRPLSRRGRLRVKLASASSTGSRAGAGGEGEAIAVSARSALSASTACARPFIVFAWPGG